jgi:hypothetical protein
LLQSNRAGRQQRKRPDLKIAFPKGTLLIDATIPFPMCPTWIGTGAAFQKGGVANEAEKAKERKYHDYMANQDGEFLGFAIDAWGAWGQSASKTLKWMRDASTPLGKKYPDNWPSLVRDLRARIAVIVQRRNARAVLLSL